MDSKFAKTKMDIGSSSNKAQLALTYYWSELSKDKPNEEKLKDLYDNFVILSVLAQCCIDSVKREFELNCHDEIDRISRMDCMNISKKEFKDDVVIYYKSDFPNFMKHVKEVKTTKNGKKKKIEKIREEKERISKRVNNELVCPMNWMLECLEKIEYADRTETENTLDFVKVFSTMENNQNQRQRKKIESIVNRTIDNVKRYYSDNEYGEKRELIMSEYDYMISEIKKIKNINIVTMNLLIRSALACYNDETAKRYGISSAKYSTDLLNVLYKTNKDKFLSNFF